jgi:uncharacterized protein YjbI with pentapeptide repeats
MKTGQTKLWSGMTAITGAALLALTLTSSAVRGENADDLQTLISTGSCAGCNLAGANLSGVDLSGADLTGASLYGANLVGANLIGAVLTGAKTALATTSEQTTCPDGQAAPCGFVEENTLAVGG